MANSGFPSWQPWRRRKAARLERVLAGQKISRQNGVLYGAGNIIGYDRDKVNRTYVINEEQAATIRMVFTPYSQGYGEKAIVNELSRLGRKDGHGNVSWSCTKSAASFVTQRIWAMSATTSPRSTTILKRNASTIWTKLPSSM